MLTLPVLIAEFILGVLLELGMDLEDTWGENAVIILSIIVVAGLALVGIVCLLAMCSLLFFPVMLF